MKNKFIIWAMTLNILSVIGIGFGITRIREVTKPEGNSYLWLATMLFLSVLTLILGQKVQVFFHELGHLIGGILTGYKFVSFTTSKWTLIKADGKLRWKKYSYGGAAGRVLSLPPAPKVGTTPYKLMMSGGIITDFFFSIIYFSLFLTLTNSVPWLACICLVMASSSLHSVLLNGLPFNNDGVTTDGYILTGLGRARDKTALPVFIANLRAEALLQTGVPVGDLPTALFDPLTTSNMTNSIHHVSLAAQKSAQLLDNERFTEAKEIILNLNTYEEIKLPIQAEHLLLELITTTDQDIIQQLYTDELKNFLATISTHENQKVSVFRLLYACARLIDKDDAKAQEYLTLFEIACKNSIVFGAIPAAKKIIALVDKLADEQMA